MHCLTTLKRGMSRSHARGASRQPPAFAISPPMNTGTVASITLPLELRMAASAYGLTSKADSGPFARSPASCAEVPQHAVMRVPLRRAVAAVSAARLAAAVLQHAGWCAAALTALDDVRTSSCCQSHHAPACSAIKSPVRQSQLRSCVGFNNLQVLSQCCTPSSTSSSIHRQ